MSEALRAVLVGMLVMLAGTLPRNIFFALNLQLLPAVPWAIPVTAVYLWFFWRYLHGDGPPNETANARLGSLRARALPLSLWAWSILAGTLGIVALVFALRVANRLVELPQQVLPAMPGVPRGTVLALLLFAAPVAGLVEESAFRGYMQGPLEKRFGLGIAILVTGTMFAIAHLDFTPVLWPYYVAVSALYGIVVFFTKSVLPAIVLHTIGNLYSNFDLWLHGTAEWQAPAGQTVVVWSGGADRVFWNSTMGLAIALLLTVAAFAQLARVCRRSEFRDARPA